ncbi:MAG: M56 family metallopeptidase [Mucilaginibacter sp.]
MDFSIIKLFPDNLVKALCDTLIHSLWQGLLMAAVTGLIIIFTRTSAPARRYNLLIATMVLFAAGTVCTFIIELNQAQVPLSPSASYYQVPAVNMQPVIKYHATVAQKNTVKDTLLGYFNRNASVIVLIWFMIVCARCLQLATGLQGIYYLRHKNIFKADRSWEDRVAELAENLGIKRMVTIAESGLAKVPMVIGHLKPLILIPVGLLTAMPAEEIEAVLVHELAHIRRSDYLVNLLQSLMEIVFFFNPAVLWISALIKTERENCCDDIAVAQSSSKVNYIKALVSCQEYNAGSPAYVMALKGNKKHLKDRVTRIISNSNHSLNRLEKSLLAICLVTAGLCTAAFTNAAKINKLVASTSKAVIHAGNALKKEITPKIEPAELHKPADASKIVAKPDTISPKFRIYDPAEIGDHTSIQIPNGKFATRLHKEKGILYQLNYKHNVLVSMQVNGKTIPSDEVVRYQSVIDGIPHDHHIDAASVNENAADHAGNADAAGQQADQRTLSRLDAAKKLNISQSELQSLDAQRQKRDLAISDSVYRAYKKVSVPAIPAKPYLVNAPVYETSYVAGKPYSPYKPNEFYKGPAIPLKDEERRDKVISEMISDGLITSKNNLSFKISTSEFIVNGKKQPDAIYQKYRAKYVKIVKNGEWSWLYNYDTDNKTESNTIIDNNPGKQ